MIPRGFLLITQGATILARVRAAGQHAGPPVDMDCLADAVGVCHGLRIMTQRGKPVDHRIIDAALDSKRVAVTEHPVIDRSEGSRTIDIKSIMTGVCMVIINQCSAGVARNGWVLYP